MASFEESVSGLSSNADEVSRSTQSYYGEILSSSDDLQTNACCTDEKPPAEVKAALKNVSDVVLNKYYGCGLVYPEAIKGKTIVDLGCGAGRDVYVLAQLVGENGKCIGVDFTEAQLETAKSEVEAHRKRFGFAKANVEFIKGNIEDLSAIASDSVDVVISNCVVNLAKNKRLVLKEAYRVLREGGEFYFSDVYSTRRVPLDLRYDKELWGECLSGALYWNDFDRLARECGFLDPRLVKSRLLTIGNSRLEEKLGGKTQFYSATYRLFKLPALEPDCEDYGQAVVYRGTIPGRPAAFDLDGHHTIEKGKVFPVCGNTWRMLKDSRLSDHFDYIGDFSTHYGIFDGCGKGLPFASDSGADVAVKGSCC